MRATPIGKSLVRSLAVLICSIVMRGNIAIVTTNARFAPHMVNIFQAACSLRVNWSNILRIDWSIRLDFHGINSNIHLCLPPCTWCPPCDRYSAAARFLPDRRVLPQRRHNTIIRRSVRPRDFDECRCPDNRIPILVAASFPVANC